MARKITVLEPTTLNEVANSCRFCCVGIGNKRVTDPDTGIVFDLCDKHFAEYDIDDDSIPAPVVTPDPTP